MMKSMGGNPPGRRVLQRTKRDGGERPLEPERHSQAAMGEQPVVAEVDPQRTEDIDEQDHDRDSRPAEVPRHKCQECEQIDHRDRAQILPVNSAGSPTLGVAERGRQCSRYRGIHKPASQEVSGTCGTNRLSVVRSEP